MNSLARELYHNGVRPARPGETVAALSQCDHETHRAEYGCWHRTLPLRDGDVFSDGTVWARSAVSGKTEGDRMIAPYARRIVEYRNLVTGAVWRLQQEDNDAD